MKNVVVTVIGIWVIIMAYYAMILIGCLFGILIVIDEIKHLF